MLRHLAAAALVAVVSLAALPAQATVIAYSITLSGANESPPNASPGTGSGTVAYDNVQRTLTITTTFSGLLGTASAAHIHCCTASPGSSTAGVATGLPSFVGFPLGVTSGSFSATYDLSLASSWNNAFVTAHGGTTATAETYLMQNVAAGTAYFDIHTNSVPGGEVRGFLTTAAAPEPATLSLMLAGLTGLVYGRRRRR